MPEERIQRRLAAILAADVVGYSRMMQADEAGTLAALKSRRADVLQPLVSRHYGRIVKLMGDGVLVEFGSAVAAVECAVELQQAMETINSELPGDRRIVLRIGINLGDVIIEGSDLYGDGVNIAARLEPLAEPGGICISAKVHGEVAKKLRLAFDYMGDKSLKNMDEPVGVYRLSANIGAEPAARPISSSKPSIAVLPFTNMSGDSEQEYFSDGITEDIITELSRFRSLTVIARNSSFRYRDKSVDVKSIGRDLGVEYVVEGSVRKVGNRIRVTAQLIEAVTGNHLWAERYDRDLEGIFAVQDQVTARVVGAITPKLQEAEIERVRRKPTESLDAYDYLLRGVAALHKWSHEGNDEALANFYRAFEIDPNYAAAYGLAARTYVQRNACGWISDRSHELEEASKLARRAVALGHDDAVALSMAGFALADFVGDIEDGDAFIDKALELNPNLAWAWLYSGWVKTACGDVDQAIERIARARRLSPNDPQDFSAQNAMSFAYFIAGRYGEALACAQAAFRDPAEPPDYELPGRGLCYHGRTTGRGAQSGGTTATAAPESTRSRRRFCRHGPAAGGHCAVDRCPAPGRLAGMRTFGCWHLAVVRYSLSPGQL
jgi:TolB-like protein/class 3 adenylate cyclase/Tfp pilus assembly protein PilF